MTLANCQRLLEHFEQVGNKEAAKEMRERLEKKYKLTAVSSQDNNSEVSENAKKSKR